MATAAAAAALGGFGRLGQWVVMGVGGVMTFRWLFARDDVKYPEPLFEFVPTASEAAELKAAFDRHGYVNMKQLLGSTSVEQVRQMVNAVIAKLDSIPDQHQYYDVKDDPRSLKQIQRLHLHSKYFAALAGSGRIASLAEILLGERAVLQNIQYFNKPPKTSKATPPHQDGYYFHIKPNRAVTMWIALDDADEENGCLVYTCGSHTNGIRPHQASGVLGFSQKCVDYGSPADLAAEKVMTANPGDMVAHNSLMMHRAGPNTSSIRQRRAIGFIYFAESAKEDIESAAKYQKQLHQQLKAQGKI